MTERELELLFLDAIREMRDRGTIRFVELAADNSTAFNSISDKTLGYYDGEFYYCYPDSIYSEVRKFYAMQDKSFPLGKSETFKQLAIDKVILTDKNQTTRTKSINGKRPRLLWLKASALDNEEENNANNREE